MPKSSTSLQAELSAFDIPSALVTPTMLAMLGPTFSEQDVILAAFLREGRSDIRYAETVSDEDDNPPDRVTA